MIKGPKKNRLTPEIVLQRITEYDIFRYYFRGKFEINRVTYSPFRYENNPSFLIGNKHGYLYYIDFADTRYRGGCFDFVMQLYNVDLNEALMMVDRDFGLGISSQVNVGEYKRIKSEYKQPEEVLGRRYSLIQVITRKFTKEELQYWSDYYQDLQDLRENNVYSVEKVYLNRKSFPIKETELRFGYLYDGHWKIYRPFAERRFKWMPNNVPITTMEGQINLVPEQDAIISKSKKDYMVVKKVFPYSCAVQNEGIGCFSEENVRFLKEHSKRQILSFDSDVVGVANSQQITKLFGFDYCNVPRKYLEEGIKDWALLAKEYGLEAIIEHLKQKEII